jgi:hypothetical protein
MILGTLIQTPDLFERIGHKAMEGDGNGSNARIQRKYEEKAQLTPAGPLVEGV